MNLILLGLVLNLILIFNVNSEYHITRESNISDSDKINVLFVIFTYTPEFDSEVTTLCKICEQIPGKNINSYTMLFDLNRGVYPKNINYFLNLVKNRINVLGIDYIVAFNSEEFFSEDFHEYLKNNQIRLFTLGLDSYKNDIVLKFDTSNVFEVLEDFLNITDKTQFFYITNVDNFELLNLGISSDKVTTIVVETSADLSAAFVRLNRIKDTKLVVFFNVNTLISDLMLTPHEPHRIARLTSVYNKNAILINLSQYYISDAIFNIFWNYEQIAREVAILIASDFFQILPDDRILYRKIKYSRLSINIEALIRNSKISDDKLKEILKIIQYYY